MVKGLLLLLLEVSQGGALCELLSPLPVVGMVTTSLPHRLQLLAGMRD